ncbi:peptidoglycan-binding protein LysM [Noviherbaspirillum galbum]|uniref:Potassium binding protein Kbp n=1 Tax=Noviherbaspirillum galbum TaxID=2709383 RepID=A0A6B3SM36_9BURK|nr:peptidoglycan-binding protein LysM [Noviherbaspirillum galbum]NEX61833.1 peptidoglycan-binding protein LysM [Noviherbaspirillum galbum]
MSLISFLKDAGEKLLHPGQARRNAEEQDIQPSDSEVRSREQEMERAILDYISMQGMSNNGITVKFDHEAASVTISGQVPDQPTREKMVLCCGNVQGVASVNDQLTVAQSGEPESQWYEVKAGDNLSKISREVYGDANKYSAIFEANKPMLTNPDKIYPGQKLRIPKLH